MTNFSLLIFSKIISNISNLKKPLVGGEKIPDGSSYKEIPLSRVLKSMFDGSAFSIFVICISSHPRNGGESFSTMEFADKSKKLKTGVKRLPPKNLEKFKASLQKEIDEQSKALEDIASGKTGNTMKLNRECCKTMSEQYMMVLNKLTE